MHTGTLSRSRFQAYGLVFLLMAASALIGALAAMFVTPAQVVAPVAAQAASVDREPAPAVPAQLSAVSTLPEPDILAQEQRDIRLYNRQQQAALATSAEARTAVIQASIDQEMRDLKQNRRAILPASAAPVAIQGDSPAMTTAERYVLFKAAQIEALDR